MQNTFLYLNKNHIHKQNVYQSTRFFLNRRKLLNTIIDKKGKILIKN